MTPQYRIEQYLNAINAAYLGDSPLPEYPSEPVWRIEQFLAAILSAAKGDSPVMACPDPVWHIEEFARAIYDALVGASPAWPCPTATNNIEAILLAIYNVVADGTETDGIMTSWDIEKWLMDSYDAAKEGGGVEKTVSGTMVHITDALAKAALSVLASIEPTQDLHGYANPWPAGGGVNVMPGSVAKTETVNGVTISTTGDGVYSLSGTASDTLHVEFDLTSSFVIPPSSTHKCLFKNSKNSGSIWFAFYNGSASVDSWSLTPMNRVGGSYQAMGNKTCDKVGITVGSGVTTNCTVSPMFVPQSVSNDMAFSPYANICPISGRTGLNVYVSPTQDLQDATTYAVDWTTQAGTVYGGTLDVVTGLLTVDKYLYVYDGTEPFTKSGTALNGFYDVLTGTSLSHGWPAMANYRSISAITDEASSMMIPTRNGDVCTQNYGYVYLDTGHNFNVPPEEFGTTVESFKAKLASLYADGTPLTVFCKIATPLTYQLSPQEVQMLLGENYVWSSSGDTVSVTYYAEGNANPLQSLNILLGGNYSNPKTADDVSDREALEIILGGNK